MSDKPLHERLHEIEFDLRALLVGAIICAGIWGVVIGVLLFILWREGRPSAEGRARTPGPVRATDRRSPQRRNASRR